MRGKELLSLTTIDNADWNVKQAFYTFHESRNVGTPALTPVNLESTSLVSPCTHPLPLFHHVTMHLPHSPSSRQCSRRAPTRRCSIRQRCATGCWTCRTPPRTLLAADLRMCIFRAFLVFCLYTQMDEQHRDAALAALTSPGNSSNATNATSEADPALLLLEKYGCDVNKTLKATLSEVRAQAIVGYGGSDRDGSGTIASAGGAQSLSGGAQDMRGDLGGAISGEVHCHGRSCDAALVRLGERGSGHSQGGGEGGGTGWVHGSDRTAAKGVEWRWTQSRRGARDR